MRWSQATDTGWWWKKFRAYCRAPSKGNGYSSCSKHPNSLMEFRGGVLKAVWEIPVANSCCCMAKPIAILPSNYPPIKINKLSRKIKAVWGRGLLVAWAALAQFSALLASTWSIQASSTIWFQLVSGLYSCGQQFPSGGGLRMSVRPLSISFMELVGAGPWFYHGADLYSKLLLIFKPNSSSFFLYHRIS